MNERVSLAVTAAGFTIFMKRLLLDAMPTPPMLREYAFPWRLIFPTPKTE